MPNGSFHRHSQTSLPHNWHLLLERQPLQRWQWEGMPLPISGKCPVTMEAVGRISQARYPQRIQRVSYLYWILKPSFAAWIKISLSSLLDGLSYEIPAGVLAKIEGLERVLNQNNFTKNEITLQLKMSTSNAEITRAKNYLHRNIQRQPFLQQGILH